MPTVYRVEYILSGKDIDRKTGEAKWHKSRKKFRTRKSARRYAKRMQEKGGWYYYRTIKEKTK